MNGWDAFDAWLSARDMPLDLWLRDDDAGDDSPELARLLHLTEAHAVPVALAVVPAWLTTAGARRIARAGRATVLQHGIAHLDHAAPGEKRIELGGQASTEDLLPALAAGRERLDDAFGERFLPVVVPPWNRIAAAVREALPGAGFTGLSLFGGARGEPASGFRRIDSHVDPVAWRVGRRHVGDEAALAALRDAAAANLGPVGILSHHRTMDTATWGFLELCLARLGSHPGVVWHSANALFAA
jgi:hypothetical protein